MNVLISGGAKNGKSYFAQRLAQQMAQEQGVPLYYIATMIPRDEEDEARIRRHIAEREGWGFQTLEQGRDLMALLRQRHREAGETTIERQVMSEPEAATERQVMSGPEAATEPRVMSEPEAATERRVMLGPEVATERVDPRGVFLLDSITALLSNEMFDALGRMDDTAASRVAGDCTAFAKKTGNTIFVSDAIGSDAACYDPMTEAFRRGLAYIERQLAQVCSRVVEVAAGEIEEWK